MNMSRKVSKTLPSARDKKDAYADLLQELVALHHNLTIVESESTQMLQKVDTRHRASAANLLHYLG